MVWHSGRGEPQVRIPSAKIDFYAILRPKKFQKFPRTLKNFPKIKIFCSFPYLLPEGMDLYGGDEAEVQIFVYALLRPLAA